ncbi:DoxX family protein [Paenibacillus sp. tmac-D7]|uniref:DoxX family protein n=1 Tax=Paenibacillus sp. tmac-D7 TaxID=2591462 RepID=UPI0011444AD1|nr:DoxX family protein [Paenibacillus sp. tmac-D7]
MNRNVEIGQLILRIGLGLTFMIHGYLKFAGGIANVSGWFESISLPGFMAYVVALVELIGGFAVILGLGTRIISALFTIIMLVALFKVKLAAGFTGSAQATGYELEIVLLAMSAALAFSGSQLLSVERLLLKTMFGDQFEDRRAA